MCMGFTDDDGNPVRLEAVEDTFHLTVKRAGKERWLMTLSQRELALMIALLQEALG
jgi:hypothetical protein